MALCVAQGARPNRLSGQGFEKRGLMPCTIQMNAMRPSMHKAMLSRSALYTEANCITPLCPTTEDTS